ncbi:FAD-dependent oxidoreductase [Nonomuraea sp. NPDC047529]|uniref:FAD-dependent oxidoreductase n=1 Tax=Nonomuraea sp. NPDC047529 TaxID=3155623 RepID=UPI0033F678B1
MATAFAALGSSVTMLARDGVLPQAEPFAGERVTESLRETGVSVRPGAEAASGHRDQAGTAHITMTNDEQVEADEVLVADRPDTEHPGHRSRRSRPDAGRLAHGGRHAARGRGGRNADR